MKYFKKFLIIGAFLSFCFCICSCNVGYPCFRRVREALLLELRGKSPELASFLEKTIREKTVREETVSNEGRVYEVASILLEVWDEWLWRGNFDFRAGMCVIKIAGDAILDFRVERLYEIIRKNRNIPGINEVLHRMYRKQSDIRMGALGELLAMDGLEKQGYEVISYSLTEANSNKEWDGLVYDPDTREYYLVSVKTTRQIGSSLGPRLYEDVKDFMKRKPNLGSQIEQELGGLIVVLVVPKGIDISSLRDGIKRIEQRFQGVKIYIQPEEEFYFDYIFAIRRQSPF